MSDAAEHPRLRRPRIARLYRLQWEEAQKAHVLLYPEGMIQLNGSAGEILRRCDGERTLGFPGGAGDIAVGEQGDGEVEVVVGVVGIGGGDLLEEGDGVLALTAGGDTLIVDYLG